MPANHLFMKPHFFESFRWMIDDIPAKAIPCAIEREHGMLEDDLLHKRIPDSERDVDSVLSFCRFVRATGDGGYILPVELPLAHIEFYREVVKRLIRAGELPWYGQERFEETFFPAFSNAFVA
jgi:hypothetical protein